MDELIDLEELFSRRNMRGLGDFHLRSALQLVQIDQLALNQGRWREREAFRSIVREFPRKTKRAGYPIELFCDLLKSRDVSHTCRPIVFNHDLIEILNPEFKGLTQMRFLGDKFSEMINLLQRGKISGTTYSHLKFNLIQMLMFCMAQTSRREPPETPSINKESYPPRFLYKNIEILLFGELIVTESKDAVSIYSLDHLRMICDKVTERDNIMTACMIGHKLFPSYYPSSKCISLVFNVYDNYLNGKGNTGYSAIKVFEALVTGHQLSLTLSPFWPSDLFLKSTLSDLSEDDKNVSRSLIDILSVNTNSCHHLTQICGLFRSWGHPVIDVKKGMEKVREIGTKIKRVDQWTANVAGLKFLEIFFINYMNKEKQYPKFSIKPGTELRYLHHILLEMSIINRKHPEYSISDWENIRVEQTFEVPSSFNLSMIVADTAISPTRSELRASLLKGEAGLDPSQRRGVIKWMKDGVLECGPLLESVNQNPSGLENDNLLIGLYPKEREQNVKPRMFALMPLIMRSVMVVTESMLADHIIPYIPGVTMTYSMLQLQKEMIKLTSQQRSLTGESVTFCISLDFEKWNLNMRQEGTYPLFTHLGRIFGLENLYNRTYDIFRNSIIYLADGSYILNLDEKLELQESDPNLAYQGHLGGFEGLRQKGWTIFTVCLISDICDSLGIDWKLMGQGDNQVLMVTLHSRFAKQTSLRSPNAVREINLKLQTLLKRLENTFKLVGLPLKPLETWISETFFSYGKIPIYQGIPCSMSLKKISRVFYFSNEDLMTLDNALGSISTNAQASAMNDPIPIVPYVIAKWQHIQCTNLFMTYHPLLGNQPIGDTDFPQFTMFDRDKNQNIFFKREVRCLRKYERIAMAIVPKTLGGFNIITFFEMISRGFPDPPNRDFQYLCLFYNNCEEGELKSIVQNMLSLHLNDKVMYSYLISDPTGLNLLVPTNSNTAIKDMIHRTIERLDFHSKFSDWFKELIIFSSPSAIEGLSNELTKGISLNVRFLHDIVGSTLHGYCEAISSKVDKTVTLSRIALGSEDVVKVLIKNERRFINYFLWRIVEEGNLKYDHICPSRYIRLARERGWRKRLIGVDVPFPYHFLTNKIEMTNRVDSYVEVLMSDEALTSEVFLSESVGSALPYLGSVTREKIVSSPVRVAYGTEPLITRPLRLLRSIGWFVSPDSNYSRLLKDLVSAVCDLNPDHLIYTPDDVKGSMVHRYSDFAVKHGSLYLPLYGPATFLNLSTNNFIEFSKGSKNVNLHFQALLCFSQICAVSSLFSDYKQKVLRFWRSCDHCVTPVDDEFPDLMDEIDRNLIPTNKENPYLYITQERLPLILKNQVKLIRTIPKMSLDDIDAMTLRCNLTSWLVLKMMYKLSGQTSVDSDVFDVTSLDRTIYLKIPPIEFLRLFRLYMWIRVAGEKKYCESSYPTWKVVKPDIVRSLERASSSAFTIFSGYYLWDESISQLQHINASFPHVYPMSAASIAECSKSTCIGFIRETEIDIFEFHPVRLLFNDNEGDYQMHLKVIMLTDNLGQLKKCPWCIIAGLQFRVRSSSDLLEIFNLKCKAHHHVVNFSRFLQIKYVIGAPVSAAMERIGRYPEIIMMDRISWTIPHIPHQVNPGPSSADIVGWSKTQTTTLVPYLNIHRSTPVKDGLPYRIPTDSLFSCISVLSTISRRLKPRSIIVLGDGFGYSSLATSYMFPESAIWSWTLIDISKGVSHSARSSLPPTHWVLPHQLIRYDFTFERPSDIGSPIWDTSLRQAVEDSKADLVISDAELWYTDISLYPKLISSLNSAQIHHALIKIKFISLGELLQIFESCAQHFEHWCYYETLLERAVCGSGWILLRKAYRKKFLKHFNETTIDILGDKIARQTIGNYEWEAIAELGLSKLKHELESHQEFIKYQEDMVNRWFYECGLDGWKSTDFTHLFNKIRTGRRPRVIADLQGSDIYYLHKKEEEKITKRLLCVAGSLIGDISTRLGLFSTNWQLIWRVRKTRGWEVLLETSALPMEEKDRAELLRFSATARALIVNHYSRTGIDVPDFQMYTNQIMFQYVPRHMKSSQHLCTLYISKIAATH